MRYFRVAVISPDDSVICFAESIDLSRAKERVWRDVFCAICPDVLVKMGLSFSDDTARMVLIGIGWAERIIEVRESMSKKGDA